MGKEVNKYKLKHDAVLGILLGVALACAVIPFIYHGSDYEYYFRVAKTFWVAGATVLLTIIFTYSDEEKEVLSKW